MARRPRRQPSPGPFQDPLSDYSAPDYADEFEQAICEDDILDLATSPAITLSLDATFNDALHAMLDHTVACVVIVDDEKPVGIFSERDVLTQVASQPDLDMSQPISSAMTPDPAVAFESDHPARILGMMSEGGFRHLPVVNVAGQCIGVIGSRNLMNYIESKI